MTKIYLIAGELSGDQLGAHLIQGLKSLNDEIQFAGVGGPQMQAQGLESLFDMTELSVMGFAEVLPKLPGLLRRIRHVADDVIQQEPDVLVTIDSPDFCLRVARKIRQASSLKIVHYVAPSVWAWRPERAAKMAKNTDHVLALLPFEPPYMHNVGMTCDFVGHPVADFAQRTPEEVFVFKNQHGLAQDAPLLCLLPGSRRSEITHHRDVFADVLGRLSRACPDLRTVLPVASSVRDEVHAAFADAPTKPVLVEPSKDDIHQKLCALAAADVALAVSGTVSLELASQATPMVIAYTTGRVSQWIIKRKFLLDTATLVNLVSETRTVPEFIFDRFTADLITPELLSILANPVHARGQLDACKVTMERLGRGGEAPGLRAARSVLSQIE